MSRRSVEVDLVLKETPVKMSSRLNLKAPEDERHVLATPLKSGERTENSIDLPPEQPREKQGSIYERLGWDDDFDDL
jgi:DNA replication regulator SLD3